MAYTGTNISVSLPLYGYKFDVILTVHRR